MKKRSIIIRLLVIILIIFLLIIMISENVRNSEDVAINIRRKTGLFSNERLRAIAHSIRTKSWNDKDSDQEISEDLFSFSLSTDEKIDSTVKGDDSIGIILNDSIAAITIAGIEEDQTVSSVLATSLFIPVDQFNRYYAQALLLTRIEDMDLFFPDNTVAIEIYKKVDDIKGAIAISNSSR